RIKKLEELVVVVVDQIYEKPKTMINLIDLKFYMDYTYFHVVNVAVLAILLADEYGLKRQEMIYIGMASLLQDIGEMFIDSKILNKDGKLSKEEFDEIKKHPVSGYKYLKESYKIHTAVYTAVLHHHEKYDGTGYPSGIGKEKISILARIISVAEIYDALTSKRSFRNPLLPSEAMEYIMANGGVIFDLVVTKIFARKVAPFPIGTYVDLSNDISGIVVTNYEDACLRPLVRILVNNLGESVEPYLLNLRDDKKLRSVIIVGVNNIEIQKL
ncbi:MAG: HD-GYP domain-containing protein, partial [Candidatus Atribacteria bacterium]|nr:HD-GYP domain-containing protein [Candidatus Atribacteria bacterium]